MIRIGLLAVLLLTCLLRLPVAAIPLERDEGEYAYIAWRWLAGELPYVASFDQKPPGIFVAYAAILAAGGRSPAALHWGAQLWTLGTLALVFALGRHLAGPLAGVSGALFCALLVSDPSLLGNAANTELFMLLPLVGAVLAALRARERDSIGAAALAGALSGVAVLFKQTALWNAFFAGALAIGTAAPLRRDLQRGVAFAAAALVLVLVPVAAFAAAGALRPFWDCVIGHNLAYAESVPLALYPGAFWKTFGPTLRPLGSLYALALLGAAAGLAGADRRDHRAAGVALGFTLASAVGVVTGGYFRNHYYVQAAPGIALLAALGLARLLPVRSRWRVPAATLACGAILALALSAAPWYWLPGSPEAKARRLYAGNPFAEAPAVARWISGRTRPEDTLFVFGSEPEIYFLAQRRSTSRYIYVYPLMATYPDTPMRQRTVLAELAARPPAAVVVATSPASFLRQPATSPELFYGLRERLLREYRLVAHVPSEAPDRLEELSPEQEARMLADDPGLGDPRTWGSLAVWERRR